MIVWTPDCGSTDPANDLAGVTLRSPPASSPEPMQRRHTSGRQRSGRYANPNEFNDRSQGNLSYAEASVSQLPKGHSMQQYGVFLDPRAGGYPSANQQQGSANDDPRQANNQSRGPWSHGNQEGTFHVPLPYAAVSVTNGHQYSISANRQDDTQNQHTYTTMTHANSGNSGVSEVQQVNNPASANNKHNDGEHSAASVHEMNEQNMGLMHGGIDMDFQMVDPSTQSAASMS